MKKIAKIDNFEVEISSRVSSKLHGLVLKLPQEVELTKKQEKDDENFDSTGGIIYTWY